MARIEIAFIGLKVIARVKNFRHQQMVPRCAEGLVIWQQRSIARSEIGEYDAGAFLAKVGGMMHLLAKTFAGCLAGLLEAIAMTIVEPAMIEAAQAAIFDTAVTQIGAPMGAVQSEETKRAVIGAEQDQIFAQDAYRQRRATARQLFHQGHRLPVAAQQITPRRAGAGLADESIFFAGKHMAILDFGLSDSFY